MTEEGVGIKDRDLNHEPSSSTLLTPNLKLFPNLFFTRREGNKPDSVVGGHLSMRSTRRLGRAALNSPSYLTLL